MALDTSVACLRTLGPCLVLEDDPLILLDVEDTLRQLGFPDIRSSISLEHAAALESGIRLQFAVLDFEIGKSNSADLARRLLNRGVPTVFLTGHGLEIDLPADLLAIPVVAKPFNARLLFQAISAALQAAIQKP